MDSPEWSADREREVVAALAARVLAAASPSVVRVTEGVSTRVYRIRRGGETFYLRVLPEAGAGFAPEGRVHHLLRARGVRVPEVIYVEDCNEQLRRAVMVTKAIPGRSLGEWRDAESVPRRVLHDAGQQLALINSVAVDGFGWIRRDEDAGDRLLGEHRTLRAFATEHLESDLAALAGRLLSPEQAGAIRAIVDRHQGWLDAGRAYLAHGDFDLTPIFEEAGRYTGIIDFGEIRGADRWYDLGHFRMHDGETLPMPALDWLLEGYREVTHLPADAEERVCFASLLIAVRALARQIEKRPQIVHRHQALVSIPRDLAVLAAG